MRITRNKVVVFLFLAIATVLVILCFSLITGQSLQKVFSNNLLVHLLFNSIIIAIVSKERFRASRDELNRFSNNCFADEEYAETSSCDDESNVYADDLELGGADQGEYQDYDQYDSDDDSYRYDSDDDSSRCDSDEDSGSYGDSHGSDGYDEDDDDDGSYGEVWWDEDEEYDSELERKIEAFIAKVINGWKEEWFSDNMQS